MRLAALSVSAVLLSGCSWLGGASGPDRSYQNQSAGYAGAPNRCMVYSPVQPIPPGCNPASVTMATGYGQGAGAGGNYTTGGYGSHAGDARHASSYNNGHQQRVRKPKLRGSVSLGTEKSIAGSLFDFNASNVSYNPSAFTEGFVEFESNNFNNDLRRTVTYEGVVEEVVSPTLSFDDVYNTPTILKGGVEYIANPHFTVFANVGYAHAEGTDGATAGIEGTILRRTELQPVDFEGVPSAEPTVFSSFFPNQNIANLVIDFNDQRRFDVEAGARHYFDPISSEKGYRTLTPFVGGAVGVSHVNEVSFTTSQNQRFLEDAFESDGTNYYEVSSNDTVNTIYDSDWLVNGAVTAGMEWQVTPKWAMALETGVKFEQGRDLISGESGDDNISVPVTFRGSFNF